MLLPALPLDLSLSPLTKDVQRCVHHLLHVLRTKIRPEFGIICGSGALAYIGELSNDLDKDNDTTGVSVDNNVTLSLLFKLYSGETFVRFLIWQFGELGLRSSN